MEVLGEVEVWEWGGVDPQKLGDLTDSVGAIVEEEEGVVFYITHCKLRPTSVKWKG